MENASGGVQWKYNQPKLSPTRKECIYKNVLTKTS